MEVLKIHLSNPRFPRKLVHLYFLKAIKYLRNVNQEFQELQTKFLKYQIILLSRK